MFRKVIFKTIKYTSLTTTIGLSGWLTYTYFQTPSKILPGDYLNFTPSVNREENLKKLQEDIFDVLVIGGGATGCSVALDAASRGLSVALVEKNDFASGTSSRSTKLLHGGVRYLKDAIYNLDFPMFQLVVDALRERSHMLHVSPFMTSPIAILMPMYSWGEIGKVWIGLKLYEFIGEIATLFSPNLPSSHLISKSNSLHSFPLLKPEGLKASMLYYDGQQNDSRIATAIALTASIPNYLKGWKGAVIANHVSVDELVKSKHKDGGLDGAIVTDEYSQKSWQIRSKIVINCTGPHSDFIRKMADPDCVDLIVPAAGAHVVLPRSYSSPIVGLLIPETSDGRVLFYLPWEQNTIAGTTDCEVDNVLDLPKPSTDEIEFIVKESVNYLSLQEDDIRRDLKSAWSGIRPLVKDPKYALKGGSESSKLSRDHEVVLCDKTGLVSIIGGKWTTCRLMAEDTVNKALSWHHTKISAKYPCRTYGLVLHDSHDESHIFPIAQTDAHLNSLHTRLSMFIAKTYGVELDDAAHLSRSYGYRAISLCDSITAGNSLQPAHLLSPLIPNQPFLRGEVKWAIEEEMATSVVDVIANRMRLSFVDSRATLSVLDEVIELMSESLNWDMTRRLKERKLAMEFLNTMHYGEVKEEEHTRAKFVRKRTYRDVRLDQ